jgi:hypothetical protein
MSAGRHSFKRNDAARLIRVAEAAGLKITGLTLRDGTVTVLVDQPPEPAESNNVNPWDEVLTNDSKSEKRAP